MCKQRVIALSDLLLVLFSAMWSSDKLVVLDDDPVFARFLGI